MSIILECNYDQVKAACKHLRAALPKGKRDRNSAILELNFKPKEVQFSIIGAMYHFPVESNSFVKVLLPFAFIDSILKDWKGDNFLAVFKKGVVSYGGHAIESKRIKIVHLENQTKFDLPINYSELDLLRLESVHSSEELESMNLSGKIRKAREDLEEEISFVASRLSKYGVKREEIDTLVRRKLKDA